MTTTTTSAAVQPISGLATRFAAAAWRGAGAALRVLAHRGEVRRLLELNDRELKDIGLLRNDVLGALAEPLVRDPSSVLLVRSVERRGRLREVAARGVERSPERLPLG